MDLLCSTWLETSESTHERISGRCCVTVLFGKHSDVNDKVWFIEITVFL